MREQWRSYNRRKREASRGKSIVRTTRPHCRFGFDVLLTFIRLKAQVVGDFVSGGWQSTYASQFLSGCLYHYPRRRRHHRRRPRLRPSKPGMDQVESPVRSTLDRRRLNRQNRTCLHIYVTDSEDWLCGAYRWQVPGCVGSTRVQPPDADLGTS